MGDTASYSELLRRSLVGLVVCSALVALCYVFVDRPVAFYVRDHDLARYRELKWLTYPPPMLETAAPALLVLLLVFRAFRPFSRGEQVLFAACISLLVAVQFKDTLKFAFGRYWPDTWIDDNPSLIKNDEFGFHPFHSGVAYGSFPSGHTARTVAIVAVYWIAYPRWRWLGVLATLAVAVGLIGMDYHFVGDVIAGAFVGALVGMYTAALCGVSQTPSTST